MPVSWKTLRVLWNVAHTNKHSQETKERFLRLMDKGFSAHKLAALAKD